MLGKGHGGGFMKIAKLFIADLSQCRLTSKDTFQFKDYKFQLVWIQGRVQGNTLVEDSLKTSIINPDALNIYDYVMIIGRLEKEGIRAIKVYPKHEEYQQIWRAEVRDLQETLYSS